MILMTLSKIINRNIRDVYCSFLQYRISNACYDSEGCRNIKEFKTYNMKVYTMPYPLFCDMGLHLWQGNCNLYF